MQLSCVKVSEDWFGDNLYIKCVYIYMSFNLTLNLDFVLWKFHWRNTLDEHKFILTSYPPNSGKTNDTGVNSMSVQNKWENSTHNAPLIMHDIFFLYFIYFD